MFIERLRERASGIVELSETQMAELAAHYALMLKWNKALNLTRLVGVAEAVDRHYVESLFLAKHLPAGNLRIVDIGSGPGFPGFPLAVLRPDCVVSLVESHQRKSVFLREASRGMENVRVLPVRAEELRERFDWAISRAVRYADLGMVVANLAPSVALLTGIESPPSDWCFGWEAALPVPYAENAFLRLGRQITADCASVLPAAK